jgi:hypothetical protein
VTDGSYPKAQVEARTIVSELDTANRIIWSKQAATPLGVHPALSRFCDGQSYAVLYAAESFETAFIEVVIRDRFVRKAERIVPFGELSLRSLVFLSTRPGQHLSLLDLRDTGCVDIGAPTDAIRARNQSAGRTLGSTIYRQHLHIDGLIYPSRLTGADCFVVFDRAISKLSAKDVAPILSQDALPDILDRHSVRLLAE